MSDLPKISVITPSYNSSRYIEKTINSVLSQDYTNLEYIVIDGGSTDGTIDILNKYNQYLHWISEKDQGQSDAINKGVQMATGEIIAYLNSDDEYETDALRCVGKFSVNHPDAWWITGKCRFIDQNGQEIRKLATWYKNIFLHQGSYRALMVLDYVSQPATFWRKEIFKKVGYFNENFYYAMDYDFSLRVGKFYKLTFIDQYLAKYRVHSTSKTFSSSTSIYRQFDEDLEIARINQTPKSLLNLHAIHNGVIKIIYRTMVN